MGGAVLAGIAVIMLTMLAYSQMISAQERRNARLTDEINELQRSIEEIDGLERQKERLLARM
jgi:Tfp pilus assembly protein PilN